MFLFKESSDLSLWVYLHKLPGKWKSNVLVLGRSLFRFGGWSNIRNIYYALLLISKSDINGSSAKLLALGKYLLSSIRTFQLISFLINHFFIISSYYYSWRLISLLNCPPCPCSPFPGWVSGTSFWVINFGSSSSKCRRRGTFSVISRYLRQNINNRMFP